jgi:hypothetical protein
MLDHVFHERLEAAIAGRNALRTDYSDGGQFAPLINNVPARDENYGFVMLRARCMNVALCGATF